MESNEARRRAEAVQTAQQFLEAVVLPELEQVRTDLQAAGIRSELITGTDNESPRYSLTIEYPRGQTGYLIFEATADSFTDGMKPAVVFKKGDQYDGAEIELSREAVMTKIKAALEDLY